MYSPILKEIGINKEDTPWGWCPDDQRQEEWKQQREQYGFDSREMWSLDTTICKILYPRLKYFKECCIIFVDEPFEYDGQTVTLEEALNNVISGIEYYLVNKYEGLFQDEPTNKINDAFKLLGHILPMLWN